MWFYTHFTLIVENHNSLFAQITKETETRLIKCLQKLKKKKNHFSVSSIKKSEGTTDKEPFVGKPHLKTSHKFAFCCLFYPRCSHKRNKGTLKMTFIPWNVSQFDLSPLGYLSILLNCQKYSPLNCIINHF